MNVMCPTAQLEKNLTSSPYIDGDAEIAGMDNAGVDNCGVDFTDWRVALTNY